ncbi:PDDEXK-like family protein [Geomonas subterranea]|uniref:PDDEXK-like family protein n=1 Tax=Geomonas subterranea TaxID=2847989 RepID=UPI001CD23743|nr:PD-(D/E)XK nuclease family protein [Geomonas fuzhouensis]
MTTMNTLHYFFDMYTEHKAAESNASIQRLDAFARAYFPILEQSRKHMQINAPRFNIFEILGVSHYEVSTHSALLRELLDPSGTHGQGNLFFRLFLEHLSTKGIIRSSDMPSFTNDVYDDYICKVEQVISSGRIDIVIERRERGRDFCIYIENKIYAMDQERQLERYWDELQQHEAPDDRKKLIYLTISGHDPEHCRLQKLEVICLSYRKDIKEWLCRCKEQVLSEKIRHTLDQYLIAISTL